MSESKHSPEALYQMADPQLEALLDEALVMPTVAPDLADRIVAATRLQLPQVQRQPVLARIGPTMLGLAAVLLLALGAAAWVGTMRQQLDPDAQFRAVRVLLAELGAVDPTRDADIDERITLLTLQIDLAERDDYWAPAGEGLERATLQYQLDAMSDDPAMF